MRFPAIAIFALIICFASTKAQYSEYIVKFKNVSNLNKSSETILSSGASIRKALPFLETKSSTEQTLRGNPFFDELVQYHIIRVPLSAESKVLDNLRTDENVAGISPNYVFRLNSFETPNDSRFGEQWALEQIGAKKAWTYASGEGIVIGVVDTGIDFNHPDLMNNVWINSKEDINGNGRFDAWLSSEIINGTSGDINNIDDDGNGFADDVIGYDMIAQQVPNFGDWNNPDPNPNDENDHGTAVSGVIAAEQNNGIGVSGLAYKSKIMSLRVFDVTGNGETDDIAAGIVYAAMNGAKVLNFSFGEVFESPLMHLAIKFANSQGVIMVASSGNENKDIAHYPSDYPEVISVGASTETERRWDYSNYGGNLCLLAPGYLVLTTIPGAFYSLKSGTSLASPHIAAAVALLLEKNPSLKLADVKAILSATARSISPDGWDNLTGAGMLDIASALENISSGNMEITSPKMYSSFNRSHIESIPLLGSALTPLFESYKILIGIGRKPVIWDTISSENRTAKLDDTLGIISLSKLADTSYTIAIQVILKNKKILEARTQIDVYSDNNPFEITKFNAYEALNQDKNTLVLSAVSNQNSYFQMKYRLSGTSDDYSIVSDELEYSKNHQLSLSKDFVYNSQYDAIAQAIIPGKDTAEFNFTFSIKEKRFPNYNFNQKSYNFPRAYIYPEVIDFDKNGTPNIFYNDVQSLSFGKSYYAEFAGGTFHALDSLSDRLLTVGIGDSNGDGIPDILSYGGGRSSIYQGNSENKLPYSDTIFNSGASTFWAEQYYDLDGDGLEEIIAYNDSSFYAYSFKNGKYDFLVRAVLPKSLRSSGVWSGSAVGDFDGSGTPKLYFSNNNGHSFIFEYKANAFNLIYQNTEISGAQNQYVCSLDVDGDGKPEILHGTNSILPNRNDYSSQIWYFRIIGSSGPGQFRVLDSLFVSGVRTGPIQKLNTSYRNGIAKGNIDGIAGDEIIISAMPNLYVFKWNKSLSKMEPMWYYPASFSNSAWVYDFDKNGKAEIGFSTFSQTEFWEYEGETDKLTEPLIKAWALNDNSARVEWAAIAGADKYQLYQLNEDNSTLKAIGSTAANFIVINDLLPRTYYRFFIAAESTSKPSANSELSNPATVYTNNLGLIDSINIVQNDVVSVYFSVPLPEHFVSSNNFLIIHKDNADTISVKSAITSKGIAILSLASPLQDGAYALLSKSFDDYYGNPTIAQEFAFDYFANPIIKELHLARLTSYSPTLLQLEFSEPVDSSATNPENYIIEPYGRVLAISAIPGNPTTIDVSLSREFRLEGRGKNYYLTAKNIYTSEGKLITSGAGATLGFTIAEDDLSNAFVYPNPVRLSDNPEIYIAGLTRRATIEIISLDGEVLKTLSESDGNGGKYWDGTDNLGKQLKPGVYLAKVINTNNLNKDFELIKFMIVP